MSAAATREAAPASVPTAASGLRSRSAATLRGPVVPAAVAGLCLLVYGWGALLPYLTYRDGAYDLGFFDQVVERTAQGHPFQTSFLAHSFLGQHWEPVLALWAPLDLVAASPVWLLIITAAALAAAPVFAWRLARAWLGDGWAAPAAALACALDPLMARAADFGYHSEVLTPVLALAALDGAARGHRWRFLLPALALCVVKEDALLVAAGVCWMVWCTERRRDALLLGGAMLVAFGAIVGVVMPQFRDGGPGDLSGLYSYLGGTTPGAALRGALTHPERVVAQLTGGPALRGLAAALLPLAGLPLLAGWAALAVVPVLLVALLSANAYQSQLLLHYGLEAFPLLLGCALLGWRRLRTLLGSRRRAEPGIAAALAAAALAGYIVGSPLAGGASGGIISDGLARRSAVESVLARIPDRAPVSASTGLVPHLSARERVYEFPDRAFEEPWVVLDAAGPRATWTLGAWDVDAAALPAHGYHVVTSAGGVTLWAR